MRPASNPACDPHAVFRQGRENVPARQAPLRFAAAQFDLPMKPKSALSLLAVWLAAAVGRSADTPAPSTGKTNLPADETVVLSPFQVSSDSDQGYAARETLAGTRFKSELKDVASQVSILTMEFLADTASVSIDDAYRYSLNVEN